MANSKLGEQQMRTTLDDSWQATTTENFDDYNLATKPIAFMTLL